MGNCFALQEKVVKIMKTDGKILEYKTPCKVHQVLTDFSGHAIADSLPVLRHLHPNTTLLGGQLYYLVPQPPKAGKKKVRFAVPEEEGEQENSVVRIKLVITKQELQNMLEKGGISVNKMLYMLEKGGISVNKMLSLVNAEKGEDVMSTTQSGDGCEGWKPALESIPEVEVY